MSAKASKETAEAVKQAPEFGEKVATEGSAAQMMHDATKGKYTYISDFATSLNTGPVKLSFKDAPKTEEDEAQERALSMIQRSMLVGSLAVVLGGVVGWQITKRYMGVANVREFSDRMNEKMPKVSADINSSMIGQKMHEVNQESRDKISEDPELTAWRRSLRDKFNTDEGKEIARKNSIHMAEMRAQERRVRKVATETRATGGEVAAAGGLPPAEVAAAAADAATPEATAQ